MPDRDSAPGKRNAMFEQFRNWAKTAALCVSMVAGAPALAQAACDVHVETFGIHEEALVNIDVGGARARLAESGVSFGGLYYGEAFYNWGGEKDGGAYDGVLELYLNADMHKLGLWKGLCFFVNGYQIHGRSITGENVGGLMPISNLEAEPATRLFELWFEQHLFNHAVTVRVGQLAADAEFFLSEGGGYFLNGTWGWASIAAENNPGGGPAYPLATPGVRVALFPTEQTNLLVGLYNGDPAPACAADDPQICNSNGLDFELDGDPLLFAEGAYHYALADGRLPGTVKVGGWHHFGTFEDQRVDVGGELIAISANSGRPLDNNWALYVIMDQLLWRVPGSEDPKGVGMFFRFAGAPEDRNLVDFYFDAGLTFNGMVPGRPVDVLAVGFAYTGISDQVTAFDVDAGEPGPREYESLIEISYLMEVTTGWVLQPDFQYLWNPGSGDAEDATVIGVRNTFTF